MHIFQYNTIAFVYNSEKSNFCKFTEQAIYSEKKMKEQLFLLSWERVGSWFRMNPAELEFERGK